MQGQLPVNQVAPNVAPAVNQLVLDNQKLTEPAQIPNYGKRPDGTNKGVKGWLGALPRPGGGVSNEISTGVGYDGKEHLIPLLVPTLNKQEITHLLTVDPGSKDFYKTLPKSILDKAVSHAKMREKQGLSPFYD